MKIVIRMIGAGGELDRYTAVHQSEAACQTEANAALIRMVKENPYFSNGDRFEIAVEE